MSFYDLLAAKLLLFQIIETLFIIIQRKNHEDTSCRANKLGTIHRECAGNRYHITHINIYRAMLCNRTCHDKKVHNRLFGVFFIKETKNIAQWS